MRLEYSSNNSGGGWWLTDDDWRALEALGWRVGWYANQSDSPVLASMVVDGRFLGALAANASIEVADESDADQKIEAWEHATKQSRHERGCDCCGAPHYFALLDDDGNWVSGWSP